MTIPTRIRKEYIGTVTTLRLGYKKDLIATISYHMDSENFPDTMQAMLGYVQIGDKVRIIIEPTE